MPARPAVFDLLLDLGERRRFRRVADARHDRRRKVDDPIEVFVIDLVSGVTGPMVIGMGARKETQRWHARLIEAGDVGRLVGIRLQDEVEAGGHVRLLENPRPRGTRAGRLNGELVVHHAADHVEIEICGELAGGHRRLVDEGVRTNEANLLGRPQRHDHVAPARLLRQRFCNRQRPRPCPTHCHPRRNESGRLLPRRRASCHGPLARGDRSARRRATHGLSTPVVGPVAGR